MYVQLAWFIDKLSSRSLGLTEVEFVEFDDLMTRGIFSFSDELMFMYMYNYPFNFQDVPFYCPKCAKSRTKRGGRGRSKSDAASASPSTRVPAKRGRKRKGHSNSGETIQVPLRAPRPSTPPNPGLAAPSPATGAPLPSSEPEPIGSPPIKLKISFGKGKAIISPPPSSNIVVEETEEDEEERWLDAVEAGKDVSTVDSELKSIKDPKLMTARQRAMVDRQKGAVTDDVALEASGHMALDYGYKKKTVAPVLDEDTMRKIKTKRKELEMEKREMDKKKTVDKLLKKDPKAAKHIKTASKEASVTTETAENDEELIPRKRIQPAYTYRLSVNGATISVPEGFEFPMQAKGPVTPPESVKCIIPGCSNQKVYYCSRTGNPLCSIECYKKNMFTQTSVES